MESDTDSDYLTPGNLIDGKYQVRRLLGQGGMGAVVEATHVLRQARVALKFMSPHLLNIQGIVERFLNEGIAASRINSEHVVKVLDVSKLQSGQPYMVMEFLDGEDLESLLAREGLGGLADITRAVHIVLQVLRGLQVAHSAGIIHRDLKPANCFVVTHDGEPDFIKLVDFGISRVQASDGNVRLTHEGSTMGTPLYVSLEQARNAANVDERSDLYSVAVMLYELLCGHTPYLPTSIADLLFHLATGTPQSLEDFRQLPPGLGAVVLKGLARERVDRYQSAAEFAAALSPYADERSGLVLKQLSQRASLQPSRPPPGVLASPVPRSANSPGSQASSLSALAAKVQSGAPRALESSVARNFASGVSSQTPTGTLITAKVSDSVRQRAQLQTQVQPDGRAVTGALQQTGTVGRETGSAALSAELPRNHTEAAVASNVRVPAESRSAGGLGSSGLAFAAAIGVAAVVGGVVYLTRSSETASGVSPSAAPKAAEVESTAPSLVQPDPKASPAQAAAELPSATPSASAAADNVPTAAESQTLTPGLHPIDKAHADKPSSDKPSSDKPSSDKPRPGVKANDPDRPEARPSARRPELKSIKIED